MRGTSKELFELNPTGTEMPSLGFGIRLAKRFKTRLLSRPAALDLKGPYLRSMAYHKVHFELGSAAASSGRSNLLGKARAKE